MTEEKTDKKECGISLRIQLIVGVAVPILFLIGVGVISYRNASSGMIENYENSAIAGESGRGFSVVAEEIRKLAESSGKTAEEIRKVVGEVEKHAEHTSEKVKEAEQYVEVQEKTVQDTAHAFDAINQFIEECVKQMEEVAAGIEDMNTERRNAMSAMRRIHECSEESVKSVDSVKGTLEKQIVCAETLSTEAEGLKEHMHQLEQVIAAFKLEA